MPEVRHLGLAVVGEARRAQRIVHQLGRGVVILFDGEPVPLLRDLADLLVLQPGEAVQEGAVLRFDEGRVELPVVGMLAVPLFVTLTTKNIFMQTLPS